MKKFAVFSGFLGSGKTTAMMALTQYYSKHFGKAAMISNDLGHGVDLADHKLACLCGCSATEMTETCICYQNENLANLLNSYYDNGFDLVLSDIPGFGVGALEHVYHGLNEKFPGQFDLAPFTVLIEPKTAGLLREGNENDLGYILNAQLAEADLIVLNKSDLVDEDRILQDKQWLADHYPAADILAISALKGVGLDALARALKDGTASMRRPDIGYGGPAFTKAMGKLCEYYVQYFGTICCHDFDGNEYLLELAERIQEKIRAAGYEIPHLKLLGFEAEGEFGKVDLLGTNVPIEVTHRFKKPLTEIAVILNASAACPADKLDTILTETAKAVSGNYNLELVIHKKECFGMA